MRAHDKKKIWRRLASKQQQAGLVNLTTGQWGRGANNSMTRDMANGSSHHKVS